MIDQNKAGKVLLDLFAEFNVDQKLAQDGAELEIGGTTFKVAKMNNMEYLAERNKQMLAAMDKFPLEERNEENKDWVKASHEAMVKAFAKCILVGWDKLKFKGEIVEGYNFDVAYALMHMDDFADIVLTFAGNRKNYATITEDAAKN